MARTEAGTPRKVEEGETRKERPKTGQPLPPPLQQAR